MMVKRVTIVALLWLCIHPAMAQSVAQADKVAKADFLSKYREFVNAVNMSHGDKDFSSIKRRFPDNGSRIYVDALKGDDAVWCAAALTAIRGVAIDLQTGQSAAGNRRNWLASDPKCDPAPKGASAYRMR